MLRALSMGWLLGGLAVAADLPGATQAKPPALEFSVVNESTTHDPALRVYLTAGTNKFTFPMPEGFRLDPSSQKQVLLASPDYQCFISLGLAGPAQAAAEEADTQTYREMLLARHPGAIIREEFSLSAGGQSGAAFDMRWKNAGGLEQYERSAFIPFAAGVMEFTMVSTPANFAKYQKVFNVLLVTFRASVNGKLTLPPVRNQS